MHPDNISQTWPFAPTYPRSLSFSHIWCQSVILCINHPYLFLSLWQITGRGWWCSDDEGVTRMQWNGALLPLAGLKNRKHTLLYQQHAQLCGPAGELSISCVHLLAYVSNWTMWLACGASPSACPASSHWEFVCVCNCEGHRCCNWQRT